MNKRTLIFIVRKLVFSNKNKGIVHIISLVSLIGIAVVSCALVLVLSVFNGFTSVAKDMLGKQCPPILISAKQGNIISYDVIKQLNTLEQIKVNVPIIKQSAMVVCLHEKIISEIIGIDSSYFLYNRLDTCMEEDIDKRALQIDSDFCLMGIGTAMDLSLGKGANKMNIPVNIVVPNTQNKEALILEDKLSSVDVVYSGCFQTHSDFDDNTTIISIQKARELLSLPDSTCNYIYVLPKTKDIKSLQNSINSIISGYNLQSQNVLQQQLVYFRIVKSEKLAIYVILAFIIFIATINIISSIVILYIEKQKMNKIFLSIGIQIKSLRNIYFLYGLTINIIGCLLGVVLGLCLCLLQQHFGIVTLAEDSFVVDAYPVRIFASDIIKVIIIVLFIGALSIRLVTQGIKTKM